MQQSNASATNADQQTTGDGQAIADPIREYFANRRDEMLPFLPQRYGRVLEVGCGEGRFTTLLASGTEVWGVEPDCVSAAWAARRMHRVLVGTYDRVSDELPDAYFDLVICNDVIEHMLEPEAFLGSIRRKLAVGGHVVASIPNVRHWETLFELLWQKDWRYRHSGTLDRTHLRFYTKKSILRLFQESGLEVEQIAGINQSKKRWRRLAFSLLSILTVGRLDDVRFPQFAIRGVLRTGDEPR